MSNIYAESSYILAKFGIDEAYIHPSLDFNLLKKLQMRSEITLDHTDNIALKFANHDIVLVFHNRTPSRSWIYRFLEFLNKNPDKEQAFITSHTLINQEELFEAIKEKKFILITHRNISDN